MSITARALKLPYYAVIAGRNTGIYYSEKAVQLEIKSNDGAIYAKVQTLQDAEKFLKMFQNHSQEEIRSNKEEDPFQEEWDLPEPIFNFNISEKDPKIKRTQLHDGNWCKPVYIREDGYLENYQGDVVAYTDGACPNNQNKHDRNSGCGIFWGEIRGESYPNPAKGEFANTNNFAEANAIAYAISHAIEKGFKSVEIRTDSAYCINSLDKWIYSWKSKSKDGIWRNSKKEPIVHQTVFAGIDNMRKLVKVKFLKVKGHSRETGNDSADRLAVMGATKY